MPAPRIAPIDPPYPPAMQADFDKLMHGAPPLLLFRTVARNPRVLQRMMAGGSEHRLVILLADQIHVTLLDCQAARLAIALVDSECRMRGHRDKP